MGVGRAEDQRAPARRGGLFAHELARVQPEGSPWTDDRAPVEWVTDKMLVEQIAHSHGLDEHYLPTAPP